MTDASTPTLTERVTALLADTAAAHCVVFDPDTGSWVCDECRDDGPSLPVAAASVTEARDEFIEHVAEAQADALLAAGLLTRIPAGDAPPLDLAIPRVDVTLTADERDRIARETTECDPCRHGTLDVEDCRCAPRLVAVVESIVSDHVSVVVAQRDAMKVERDALRSRTASADARPGASCGARVCSADITHGPHVHDNGHVIPTTRCPGCGEQKFVGHGPLCSECVTAHVPRWGVRWANGDVVPASTEAEARHTAEVDPAFRALVRLDADGEWVTAD